MQTTVLTEILALLFGRKYYANIVAMNGTNKNEICSFIFSSKQSAMRHKEELQSNLSFRYIETISFRTRHTYADHYSI